jgi:L-threonylcarbamoyladenylate synthase
MPAPLPLLRPRILRPTPANLARLAAALRRGAIVGVPSETVYGLAADALSATACAGIFEAKGRPTTDPLIVHLASARELDRVALANPAARALAAACWPGPLTLVLPKRPGIPALITAGKSTVAVRVPAHPLFRKLIRLAGRPLAAPSANPFGYVSPTTAAHVRDGLAGTALRAILDGGECSVGVESTIVDLSDPARPRLLRPGGLAIEEIEHVLGRRVLRPRPARLAAGVAAPAPGMLARHYSPRTPLTLHARLDASALAKLGPDEAALLLRRPAGLSRAPGQGPGPRLHWLSERGELAAIARNLFSALRALDSAGWHRLHAELPSGTEGLAPAIRDRLTRAAAKR